MLQKSTNLIEFSRLVPLETLFEMVTLEAPFQNNIQYILHCNHSDASKFGHVQNDFSWGGLFHTVRKSAPSLPSLIHGRSLKISHRTKHFRPLPSLLGHVRTHFPPLSWRKKKDKTSKELILKEVRPVQRKSKTCYLQVYVFSWYLQIFQFLHTAKQSVG